jgi:hypothetical protein
MENHRQYEKSKRKREWLLRFLREFLRGFCEENCAERRIKQIRLLDDALRP